jgi:Na+-driven multidrug efflux pump
VLFVLLSMSLVPNVLASILVSVLRINGKLGPLLLVTGGDLIVGLLLVYVCMLQLGLLGVGIGWLLSRILIAAILGTLWRRGIWLDTPVVSASADAATVRTT